MSSNLALSAVQTAVEAGTEIPNLHGAAAITHGLKVLGGGSMNRGLDIVANMGAANALSNVGAKAIAAAPRGKAAAVAVGVAIGAVAGAAIAWTWKTVSEKHSYDQLMARVIDGKDGGNTEEELIALIDGSKVADGVKGRVLIDLGGLYDEENGGLSTSPA